MRNGVWSRCVKVSRRLIAKHFVSNCSQETKETKSLGWKYFLKHANTVSQCDFLRSWPTFASRDRLQPVCSRCRRRARCCLKDQKSQNLGILKEISKEIFAMSLSPWDPSPNRNAPAPSKSLQSSSRPAFRKHTVHKALRTCATTTTYDNVQLAIFLGPQAGRNVVSKTTEAEVAVPAVTLKQWNPMRNTVLRRGNKSKFRDFLRVRYFPSG